MIRPGSTCRTIWQPPQSVTDVGNGWSGCRDLSRRWLPGGRSVSGRPSSQVGRRRGSPLWRIRRGLPWCSRSCGGTIEAEHEADGLAIWAGNGTVLLHDAAVIDDQTTGAPAGAVSSWDGAVHSARGGTGPDDRRACSSGCGGSRHPVILFGRFPKCARQWADEFERGRRPIQRSTPLWSPRP